MLNVVKIKTFGVSSITHNVVINERNENKKKIMIWEEDIEKEVEQVNVDLLKGRKVARSRGMRLSIFKQEVSLGLLTDNNEDQWTFDYESYLLALSRGKYQSPTNWAKEYYQGRWRS